ncbi:DUF1616 domain-containing protein [Pyrococcus abyssi]|uniref:DUF1616 domain-containing protein n=1 Tax=Pyrococcus abyssi (strain GE5 / Orsay) TaxID=272844 RepID=Q9UYA2_PYRAB|nr:DUF1616 domain-containing protein [Pyrococcus abyssi]CAB50510.1 Hypothetical protein PAB1055 [Pyrococcus abyssi GE5]CCE71066.1 TPA: hypothetical protein PAB1055 [Pyrococcus abyssi GE5]
MKKYWDLITAIALSLLLDLIIAIAPNSIIRKILGLVFVLFLPGYVFITALFPEKKELDNLERLALSFGLSIAIVPLIGLALNYTSWGIRLIPILVSLTVFNVIFSIIAIYRRKNAIKPWIPWITIERIKEELEWDKASKLDKALTVILIIAIFASLGTLIYVITHPKPGEAFTEFYILGPYGKAADYPTELLVNETGRVIIGIVNHEHRNVTYFVEIWLVNLTYNFTTNETIIHEMYLMDRFNVTLPSIPVNIEGNWTPQFEMNYTFKIDKPGKWQLWFLLFKDKEPEIPEACLKGEDCSKTEGWRIMEAINGTIQSLKLNIDVKGLP